MEGIVLGVVAFARAYALLALCVKDVGWCAIGLSSDHESKVKKVDGMDLMKTESGFGMTLSQDDLTLLLIAQNARFRVASRLTTKNQTGYQIRPECDLFGKKSLPVHVITFLSEHGLPAQNRYTKPEHLSRLLRLIKQHQHFTKDSEGYCAVAMHISSLPTLKTMGDVMQALEVLENESL